MKYTLAILSTFTEEMAMVDGKMVKIFIENKYIIYKSHYNLRTFLMYVSHYDNLRQL